MNQISVHEVSNFEALRRVVSEWNNNNQKQDNMADKKIFEDD